MTNEHYAIVLGTRPEIIKLAPVWRWLDAAGASVSLIHTGQHDRADMSTALLRELGLPDPDVTLPADRTNFVDVAVAGTREALRARGVDRVIVQGDTNSTLAGALAAEHEGIPVAHVEAGLRGGETFTIEEQNTIRIAQIADLHFAASRRAVANLRRERVRGTIIFTGNTIVDVVLQTIAGIPAHREHEILREHGVRSGRYILFTAHKAETINQDCLPKLMDVLEAIDGLGVPIIWPCHPHTADKIRSLGVRMPRLANVELAPPLPFAPFLVLEKNAMCMVTDSGGAQEECCTLGTPILVLKHGTQRPSVIDVGAAILCGLDPDNVRYGLEALQEGHRRCVWTNPFGSGSAATRIADALLTKPEQRHVA